MRYRRSYVPGGTFFFTVNTNQRQPTLVDHVASLREAFRHVRLSRPFTLNAIVILPDHLHAGMTLPTGGTDY